MATQLLPPLDTNVALYPCLSCVQFPRIKTEEIAAQYRQISVAAGKPIPQDVDVIRSVIAPSIAQLWVGDAEKAATRPLPSPSAIKTKVPMFQSGGGGLIIDGRTGQTAAGIPMYKCDDCRALYVFPQDAKDAANGVGIALGENGLSDDAIKSICLNAFENAYKSLPVWKAEVYCFNEFIVMIDLAGNKEGKDRVKEKILPFFDISGLLALLPKNCVIDPISIPTTGEK